VKLKEKKKFRVVCSLFRVKIFRSSNAEHETLNLKLVLSPVLSLLLFIIFVLFHSAIAFAGDALLSWDPNIEPDIAGYRIYLGTSSGTYGTPIDVGNQTTHTVTGLADGTHFFAVTAYDTSGNESGFSLEVSKTISETTTPLSGGGCGMITPKNGNQRGPGQSADMVAVVGVMILLLTKNVFDKSRKKFRERGGEKSFHLNAIVTI